MAEKGTRKWFSLQQEHRMAQCYGGAVSRSSGAADHDQGDVRVDSDLIECKHTGMFTKPAKSISVKLNEFEKITQEAWSEGRRPGLALSIYAPGSVLANHEGYVDLMVRTVSDDVALLDTEWRYEDLG